MTRREALEVLELRPNYTEEELKKAHHLKLKQYHTDNYSGWSETEIEAMKKETQRINEAKEVLKNKNEFDQEQIEMRKISYLSYFQTFIANCDDKKLKSLARQYTAQLKDLFSLSQIEDLYQEFVTKKQERYKEIFREYCLANKISPSFGASIDLECEYKELIEQLEAMKYEYQRYLKKMFPNDMNAIVEKFSMYAGFKNVEKTIMTRKREIQEETLHNFGECYLYITEILTIFDKFVYNTIEKYHQNLRRLHQLASRIKKVPYLNTDEQLKKLSPVRSALEIGLNEEFDKAYNAAIIDLDSIEQAMEIEDIYEFIKTLADSKLQKLHIIHDSNLVTNTYQTLIEVCMLLKAAYPLRVSQSVLSKLKSIRFCNYESDRKIIDEVTEAINIVKLSTIYVGQENIGELPFYCFDYTHGCNSYVGFDTKNARPSIHHVDSENSSMWLPLSVFLNTYTFIGKPAIDALDSSAITVLYLSGKNTHQKMYLCYNNNKKKFVWIPYGRIRNVTGYRAIVERQEIETKFLDRNFIEKLILKQAQQIRMHEMMDEMRGYDNPQKKF